MAGVFYKIIFIFMFSKKLSVRILWNICKEYPLVQGACLRGDRECTIGLGGCLMKSKEKGVEC